MTYFGIDEYTRHCQFDQEYNNCGVRHGASFWKEVTEHVPIIWYIILHYVPIILHDNIMFLL